MGAVRYSCLIRLVPTYRFNPNCFNTERLVFVETGRRTWVKKKLVNSLRLSNR